MPQVRQRQLDFDPAEAESLPRDAEFMGRQAEWQSQPMGSKPDRTAVRPGATVPPGGGIFPLGGRSSSFQERTLPVCCEKLATVAENSVQTIGGSDQGTAQSLGENQKDGIVQHLQSLLEVTNQPKARSGGTKKHAPTTGSRAPAGGSPSGGTPETYPKFPGCENFGPLIGNYIKLNEVRGFDEEEVRSPQLYGMGTSSSLTIVAE